MTSNSYPDNYYQQSIGHHLQAQFTSLQPTPIDYASALRSLQYYSSAIVPLNGQLRHCSNSTEQQPVHRYPSGRLIKLKIARLCRRAVICSKKNNIDQALKLLELGLHLSATKAEKTYNSSQYDDALVLSM